MDDCPAPSLTEPGMNYFIKETLKQCTQQKYTYYSSILNSGLLFLFIVLLGVCLIYKKRTKLTEKEKREKTLRETKYILEKIKSIQKKSKEQMITSLPKFESNFVLLHKNYYKI